MNDSRDISETRPFVPSGTFNGFKHDELVTRYHPVHMYLVHFQVIKTKKFNVN